MNDPLIYVVPTGLIRNAKMSGAKGIRGKKGVGASFNWSGESINNEAVVY